MMEGGSAPFLNTMSVTRISVLLLITAVAVSCTAPSPQPFPIDSAKLVDLSYTYDAQTIYWPNAEGFRHQKDQWAINKSGFWYAAGNFASAEHGGTHLDSPIHFSEGKQTVDQLPVASLIGHAAVIDVSPKAEAERDYRVTVADITDWEAAHGALTSEMIAIFRTGWGKHWPDRLKYMGTNTPGDTANLHFPGLSREAAMLLAERHIKGVGIDTASIDYGPSTDFIAHQILNGAGIYGLENIANAGSLPATGATVIALPMKIGEGTGAPTRIIAILP
jgi:kynurenine formamidase